MPRLLEPTNPAGELHGAVRTNHLVDLADRMGTEAGDRRASRTSTGRDHRRALVHVQGVEALVEALTRALPRPNSHGTQVVHPCLRAPL
jgi:hypothetical protein